MKNPNRLRLTWCVFTHCIWGNNFINAKKLTPIHTRDNYCLIISITSTIALNPGARALQESGSCFKNIVISFIEITFQFKKISHHGSSRSFDCKCKRKENIFFWKKKTISDIFTNCLIFNIMRRKGLNFQFLFATKTTVLTYLLPYPVLKSRTCFSDICYSAQLMWCKVVFGINQITGIIFRMLPCGKWMCI